MRENHAYALARAHEHKETPFPDAEFAERLRRVRQAMTSAGIDVLFATAPESIYYLTGFQCEWYQAQSGRSFPPSSGVAIHADRDDFIHFETPSEAILVGVGTCSRDVRIFPLESRRDGVGFVLKELAAESWLKGRAALELYNYRPNPVVAARYKAGFEAAGMDVVDGADIIRGARKFKSPLEMEAMVEAARIAEIGMAAAREAIQPGVSELAVFGEMVAAMTKAGGEFPSILPPVMSGFRSNCLHPLASRKTMAMGERVTVDLCGVFKRYHVNLARSFWLGEPPAAALEMHEKSIGAFDVIAGMLKPDLNVVEMLTAVTEYYRSVGILEQSYWTGGYEMGLSFPPDWVGGFIYDLTMTAPHATFEPMTAVNFECDFHAPEALGMSATIDTMLFHQDRAEFACQTPRALEALCA